MGIPPLLSFLIGSILITLSLSTPLSKSDLKSALKIFGPNENGLFGSLEDTLQSVRVMDIVTNGKANSPSTCKLLQNSISPSSSLEDASSAIKIAAILNCPEGSSLSKIVQPIFLKSVVDNLKLTPIYLSTTALASMADKGWISESDKIQNELKYVFLSLQKLVQNDGSWKYNLSDKNSYFFTAGPGLEALAALMKLNAFDSSNLPVVKSFVAKLMKKAVSSNGLVYFSGENSLNVPKIEATSAILRGLFSLISETGLIQEVSSSTLVSSVAFVLSYGIKSSSLGASFDVIDISALSSQNKWFVPLFVTLPATHSLSSSKSISIQIYNALGNTPADVAVNILSLSAPGKSDSLISNLNLTPDSKNNFIFALPSDNLKLGIHTLQISALSKEEKFSMGGPVLKKIKFTDSVVITNSKFSLFDSDSKFPEEEISLKFGDSKTISLSATHLQRLSFSFQLSLKTTSSFITPQQVFVYFTHESGLENIFLMKQSSDKFSIQFVFLELMQKLFYLSGDYKIKLFIGDSNIENSLSWTLGSVDINFPEPPENAPKPPPKPITDLSSRFGPKQEIHHIFRKPETRPPPNVSYAFTFISILPLLLFLSGLMYLGVNFKGFPSPLLPKLSAIAFHAGIAAILLLFAFFWIKLNLFATLKYLVLFGVVTSLPGYLTLSYLADSSPKLKTT